MEIVGTKRLDKAGCKNAFEMKPSQALVINKNCAI